MLDRMQLGRVAKKHHVVFKSETGALYHEECITRAGFDGPYTIAYHEKRPHTAHLAEAGHGWKVPSPRDTRLSKRHYVSGGLAKKGGAPVDARVPLLFNADVTVGVLFPDRSDPTYFVNADADDLYYVHEGGGTLRTVLGDVRFTAEDYVCVPRGLLHRFVLDAGKPQHWLVLECTGEVGTLKQFRNDVGQLKMDAPYTHRDFKRPELFAPMDEGVRELVVKREGRFHGFRLDDSPLDVVGWDGTYYPWAFPILAFQPRAQRRDSVPGLRRESSAQRALISACFASWIRRVSIWRQRPLRWRGSIEGGLPKEPARRRRRIVSIHPQSAAEDASDPGRCEELPVRPAPATDVLANYLAMCAPRARPRAHLPVERGSSGRCGGDSRHLRFGDLPLLPLG